MRGLHQISQYFNRFNVLSNNLIQVLSVCAGVERRDFSFNRLVEFDCEIIGQFSTCPPLPPSLQTPLSLADHSHSHPLASPLASATRASDRLAAGGILRQRTS